MTLLSFNIPSLLIKNKKMVEVCKDTPDIKKIIF